MRSEFEKLPSISVFLPSFKFNETKNEYERSEEFNQPEYTLGFFNGAWYAFQHQQSKVDELQKRVDSALWLLKVYKDEMDHGFEVSKATVKKLEQALKGG